MGGKIQGQAGSGKRKSWLENLRGCFRKSSASEQQPNIANGFAERIGQIKKRNKRF